MHELNPLTSCLLQDYLRYGLELAEYHLLEGYDEIKDKTDAQDRVFLESVQVRTGSMMVIQLYLRASSML